MFLNRTNRDAAKALPSPVDACPDVIAAGEARQAARTVRVDLETRLAAVTAVLDMPRDASAEDRDAVTARLAAIDPDILTGRQLVDARAVAEADLGAARRAEAQAKATYDAVRDARSRDLLEAMQPAHRAAVRRIAAAIAELSAASAAEAQMRHDLTTGGAVGVDTALPPMAYPDRLLGAWGVYGSPAAVWIETARRWGFLGPAESPERLSV